MMHEEMMRWWDDPWVHESMSPCLHDHCDWPLTIHHQYGQVYPMMTINDNKLPTKYHILTWFPSLPASPRSFQRRIERRRRRLLHHLHATTYNMQHATCTFKLVLLSILLLLTSASYLDWKRMPRMLPYQPLTLRYPTRLKSTNSPPRPAYSNSWFLIFDSWSTASPNGKPVWLVMCISGKCSPDHVNITLLTLPPSRCTWFVFRPAVWFVCLAASKHLWEYSIWHNLRVPREEWMRTRGAYGAYDADGADSQSSV